MGNKVQRDALKSLNIRIKKLDFDHVDIKLKKMPSLKQKYFTQTIKNKEYVFTDSDMTVYNYKEDSWEHDRELYKYWEPNGDPFSHSQDKSEIYVFGDTGFLLINKKLRKISILESKENCNNYGLNYHDFLGFQNVETQKRLNYYSIVDVIRG